ncbi:hypothetical protein FEM48_Zijuj07G0160800 [Ziziphus jujuba var. spinosa]|uniref:Leucine-rich repeat-containing N-terminal plant-type domain-containing protein n=1 Tax=Ziziphus jujuba var. spinosa TaxID=714518 RepID=A0A978V5L3_ZIZJJ|nr:hypothetical protein FEM48_Zijuj07G0160800 [Ziziphus jujuba var. spinosa]
MEISVLILLLKLLMKHIFIFQCALSSSSPFSSSSKTNNNADMFALLAIKSKIQLPSNGPILSSWNPSNTSFCNWVGVSCSLLYQRVSALNMSYMNIHGTISPHIGNLSFLRTLKLGSNSFRVQQLGRYHSLLCLQYLNLKVIALSYNGISRGIPNDMYRMLPKLEILYLSVNPLGGHIPASLCLCRNLKELELRENGLIGSIPTHIGCFSEIEYLSIPINQLTGTIPISLGNLSKLEFLDLSENNLSGTIQSSPALAFLSLVESIFVPINSMVEFQILPLMLQCSQSWNYLIIPSVDLCP